jgi:hypothetical protein
MFSAIAAVPSPENRSSSTLAMVRARPTRFLHR